MTRSRIFLLAGALGLGFFLVGSVLALRLTARTAGSGDQRPLTLMVSAPGTDGAETELVPGSTRTLNLGSADRLKVSGAWKVVLVPGPEGQARLTAPEDSSLRLRVRNDGGTVSLSTTGNGRGKPILEVSLPRLRGLEASGASEFDLNGLQADQFVLETSGACTIAASGTVRTLELNSSGASNVDWSRVEASEVRLDSSGAGNLVLRCAGRVEGQLSGAVNLQVLGHPDLHVDSSGAAQVTTGP